jgi:hypothetical protein
MNAETDESRRTLLRSLRRYAMQSADKLRRAVTPRQLDELELRSKKMFAAVVEYYNDVIDEV